MKITPDFFLKIDLNSEIGDGQRLVWRQNRLKGESGTVRTQLRLCSTRQNPHLLGDYLEQKYLHIPHYLQSVSPKSRVKQQANRSTMRPRRSANSRRRASTP